MNTPKVWIAAAMACLGVACAKGELNPTRDAGVDAAAPADAGPPDAIGLAGTCEACESGDSSDCLTDYDCVTYESHSVCMPHCNPVAPDCPDGYVCGGTGDKTFCEPADQVCCYDQDEDNYGLGYDCLGPDCNDGDPDVNPEADELCNGVDDDCNPATVDGSGDSQVGIACDGAGDADLCPEGISSCQGGELSCDDPNTENPELCNGVDDDCNPDTPDGADDSDIGVPCDGPDGDLCEEGHVVCASGGVEQCDDNTITNVEICNGIDDNCMDGVDEMNPDTSCPSQLPSAGNVADWACDGACVIVSCNSLTADIDHVNSNGCECTGLDAYGDTCGAAATYSVAAGATVTRTGRIETASGEDWLRFNFTPRAAPGNYHPKVQLTSNGGGQFAMEVRTSCTTVATCGTGTGSSVTTWEGNWTYTAGAGCCTDNTPKVTSVWVHITRTNGTATCTAYTVVATNP